MPQCRSSRLISHLVCVSSLCKWTDGQERGGEREKERFWRWRSTVKPCGSGPLTVLIYAVVGIVRLVCVALIQGFSRPRSDVYVSMHECHVWDIFVGRQAPDSLSPEFNLGVEMRAQRTHSILPSINSISLTPSQVCQQTKIHRPKLSK